MRFKPHLCIASAIVVSFGWAEAVSADAGSVTVEAGTVEQPDARIAAAQWWSILDAQSAVDLVDKGGPVVVVLIIMSLLATTVIIFKFIQFVWIGAGSQRPTETVLQHWIAGRSEEALAASATGRSPSARALAHGLRGLRNGVDEGIMREDVERVALQHLGSLRTYMRVLEATVQIAPLLGLFGTVIGMITAFQSLQIAGSEADPAVLAGGIWVALMTTAVGLAVAIPVAFCNYWLESRIEREREATEAALTSLFTRRATAVHVSAAPQRTRLATAAE